MCFPALQATLLSLVNTFIDFWLLLWRDNRNSELPQVFAEEDGHHRLFVVKQSSSMWVEMFWRTNRDALPAQLVSVYI